MKYAIMVLTLTFLQGCTHLHSLSTTSIPANRSKKVRAESSKTIILGFNFSNEYVERLPQELARQCPNGRVRGILTKHETTNYFLYFVWKSRVTAEGYCQKRVAKKMRKRKRRRKSASDENSVEYEAEIQDVEESI